MRPLFATVLAGLLYGLLFPPHGLAALSWIALAPLAWALRGRGFGAAAGLAFGFAAVGTAAVVPWLVPTLRDHFALGAAGSLAFLLQHESYHIGQLAYLRRLMGHEPMSYW